MIIIAFLTILSYVIGNFVLYNVSAYNKAELFYNDFVNALLDGIESKRKYEASIEIPDSISNIRVEGSTIMIVSYDAGL